MEDLDKDYKANIKEKAKRLRDEHKGEVFSTGYVYKNGGIYLSTIATRFANNTKTDVESIKSVKRVINYMICAKLIGDHELYNKLNEYSGGYLEPFCSSIEQLDNIGVPVESSKFDLIGFEKVVDLHLFRLNHGVYLYLKKNRIRFIDAGLALYGGSNTNIFLPQFNMIIRVEPSDVDDIVANESLKEIKKLVDSTPEKDRHNDTDFNWEMKILKGFTIIDGHVRVTGNEKAKLDASADYITEYIVDSETDPDDINNLDDSAFTIHIGKSNTKLYRQIRADKLPNGTQVMIKRGVVYYDNNTNTYKIIGHDYSFWRLLKYDNLNNTSIMYNCTGLNKDNKKFVTEINLGKRSGKYEISKDSWLYDRVVEDKCDEDYLYLFYGKTLLGKISYREDIDFNGIKTLLDNYLK